MNHRRETAIRTIHALGKPERSLGYKAFVEMDDDDILFSNNGIHLTVGDVRELQQTLIEFGALPSLTRTEELLVTASPRKPSA